jgi:hypothetical protein
MKLKPVLIPTTVENADLHYPVDRGICHQTILLRVNIRRCLLPCSNPAALLTFHMGIRDGIDLRIKIQPSSYLNKELFLEFVREVFPPAVKKQP